MLNAKIIIAIFSFISIVVIPRSFDEKNVCEETTDPETGIKIWIYKGEIIPGVTPIEPKEEKRGKRRPKPRDNRSRNNRTNDNRGKK